MKRETDNPKWGGKRPGAGRPIQHSSELEYQKFAYMVKMSDMSPIQKMPMEMCCQEKECSNMTTQGIIQGLRGVWSIRPICPACIVESGHEPLS